MLPVRRPAWAPDRERATRIIHFTQTARDHYSFAASISYG
jgi:hypothetical protein